MQFTRASATAVMHRFLSGEISPSELERWADAVEGREDIGLEPGSAGILRDFIFEVANPSLSGPITSYSIQSWLSRLNDGDVR